MNRDDADEFIWQFQIASELYFQVLEELKDVIHTRMAELMDAHMEERLREKRFLDKVWRTP